MSAQFSATPQPAAELDSAATQEPEGFKQIANIRQVFPVTPAPPITSDQSPLSTEKPLNIDTKSKNISTSFRILLPQTPLQSTLKHLDSVHIP
jgi:hypothetical protein